MGGKGGSTGEKGVKSSQGRGGEEYLIIKLKGTETMLCVNEEEGGDEYIQTRAESV